MSYKKENLIKLLKLIEEISNQPGNEWFKSDLRNVFIKSNEALNQFNQGSLEAKINLIHKDRESHVTGVTGATGATANDEFTEPEFATALIAFKSGTKCRPPWLVI